MAIIVPITSQWNPKGVNQATKSITSLDGITKKLGGTLATVFAAKQVVSFFAASVRAAMEDQKAQVQLERSIRNTTNATSAQIAGLSSFIRETQFSTGVLDDQLRPALNRLVLATGDVEKSQKLLSLALDISAGTGKDLETVTQSLSKAAGGQYTSLQRLGVGLSKTVLETKDLDIITGVLATKFSGQATAAAQTFGGQMNILNSYFQEAKEIIGGGFIQALESFTNPGGAAALMGQALLRIADYIADVIVGVATVINQFRDFGRRLDEDYPSLARWVEALGNVGKLFGEVIKRFTVFGIIADVGNQTRELAETNKLAGDRYQLLAEKVYGAKSATANLLPTIEKATKATKGLTDAQKSLINANIKVQESIVNNLQDSFNKAESALDSIQGKFDDLRNTISGSVTDVVDFGAAIETGNFLEAITNQAEKATTFADKIKQLIQLGLSERGIRELLDSGFEAGSLIADQLISGGSTIVNQVNTLLEAINTVANTVGQLGAETFYQQGVQQGQALVAGIKASLEAAKGELDRLRESLTGSGAGTTTAGAASGTTAGATGSTTVTVKPGDSLAKIAAANNTTLQAILAANTKFTSDPKYKGGSTIFSGTTVKIPKFAKGGIINGPTVGMIGEAGPEAIVPLTGKSSKSIGTTYNITVNAGIGTNGSQVGKEIVDAIKRFERSSGPVFASA
jgi:LysM repeat protein